MRAGWMRPSAISRLDRLLGNLAAVRVEAREDDRAGRVVDDQIDAGGQFERADVAPLAADDAPLEVVARQIDDRDGGLDGVLGGAALDGLGDVLLGAVDGRLARFGVEPLEQVGRVVPRVGFDLLEQQLLGFVGGQAGDAFELVLLPGDQLARISWPRPSRRFSRSATARIAGGDVLLEAVERRLPLVERRVAAGEGLLERAAPAGAPAAPGARPR